MNIEKRKSLKLFAGGLFLAGAAVASGGAMWLGSGPKDALGDSGTSSAGPVPGTHYTEFEPLHDGMPEVMMVFWYGCPHCQAIRAPIRSLEEGGVEVEHRHSLMSQSWVTDALFFYSAKQLPQAPQLHESYFDARTNSRGPLDSENVASILEDNGLTLQSLKSDVSGKSLEREIDQTQKLERHYQLRGVPSIIVKGRYRMENGAFKNYQELMDAVRTLLDKP